MNRRELLKHGGAGAAMLATSQFAALEDLFASNRRWFRIGACDWSIGMDSNVEGMELGRKIGLDGIQINMGHEADDLKLRRPEVRQAYKDAAKKFGVRFSGLGLAELNNVPYKSDPRTEQWVSDSIDVAKAMGIKVVLLAFFHKNDLKNDAAGTQTVIERLKKVAPKAEKEGITLGIESWLNAEEHMHIIDSVASKNVKVYYDVCNSEKMGYNIYEEIRWLGKQNQICEFHMKENGYILGTGRIDFKKVRSAIEDINYNGWMQIEGAIPEGQPVFESYVKNLSYLRPVFPETKRS